MKELKMFVWEDVLPYFGDNIICVVAHDEKEANDLIHAKNKRIWKELKDENIRPKIITKPKAFIVYRSPFGD